MSSLKCIYCKNDIDEKFEDVVITPPDGDCFHAECKKLYDAEKLNFLNNIIYDENMFLDWCGVPKELLK